MNRLIILGNGFDLAHGLKTSYSTEKTQQISRHFEDKELMRERILYFNPNDSVKDLIG